MTDGDLVKIEIDDERFVSIVLVDTRAEATHIVTDSWRYKDFSHFGLTFEVLDDTSQQS